MAAKQARHREAMREPAIACPRCEAQTTVADLLRHAETCPGPREPHQLSRWITWAEALELGVAKATLHRWVRQGRVHSRVRARADEGPRPRHRPAIRVYLVREIVKLVAHRRQVTSISGSKQVNRWNEGGIYRGGHPIWRRALEEAIAPLNEDRD